MPGSFKEVISIIKKRAADFFDGSFCRKGTNMKKLLLCILSVATVLQGFHEEKISFSGRVDEVISLGKTISTAQEMNKLFGDLFKDNTEPIARRIYQECLMRDRILNKPVRNLEDFKKAQKAIVETLPLVFAIREVRNLSRMHTQGGQRSPHQRRIRSKVVVPGIAQDEKEMMFDWFIERAEYPLRSFDVERHRYLKKIALKMSDEQILNTGIVHPETPTIKRNLSASISSAEDLYKFKTALRDTTNMRTIHVGTAAGLFRPEHLIDRQNLDS